MSLSTLDSAISDVDIQTRVAIMALIANGKLYAGATSNQLASIIKNIDEVSNGSGLQIVSIMMWPDDELPEVLKPMVDELLSNLTIINA